MTPGRLVLGLVLLLACASASLSEPMTHDKHAAHRIEQPFLGTGWPFLRAP